MQQTPATILGRFGEQLELAENFQIVQQKLMAYFQGPHKSLDNFVSCCKIASVDFSKVQ